jgi:hypothetical protein
MYFEPQQAATIDLNTASHCAQAALIRMSSTSVLAEGEGQLIALYSAKEFAEPPYSDERFTGDGS